MNNEVHVDIPADVVTGDVQSLWFEFANAVAPGDVGLANDNRQIALGFVSVTLEQRRP